MRVINHRIFIFTLLVLLSLLSQAQHMFFHLLPGFVPAYTWVGLGGDANWNNAANWSTGVVPGAANTAIFNDICVSNCDPTINVSISIGGMDIKNTYAGIITQGAGSTITVGASGWVQASGIFNGSDANIQINGVTNMSGGTFASTSATLEFKNAVTIPALNFSHNSGTVDLNLNCQVVDFNLGAKTLNHFRIIGQCGTINLQTSTITVEGNLTLADTNGGTLNNGTVNVQGHVTMGSYGSGGTAWVRLTGGAAQTITNADINQERPKWPFFEIAKSAGTVATFNGRVNLTKDFIYTSGTIAMGTSVWAFIQDCTVRNIRPGTWNYPDVLIIHSCGTLDFGGETLKVTGTLTLGSTFVGSFANGTIEAYSHVTQSGIYGLYDANPVTGTLKIIGAGNQTITGGAGRFPKTEMASTGGTVTFVNTLTMMSDYTHTSGTVDAGTSTLAFIGNAMVTPGGINYYNVTFAGDNKTQNLNAGSMNVTNTLTIADTNAISGLLNNGNINASGHVLFSNYGKSGTAVLNYTGTASTNLTIGVTALTLTTTHNVTKTGAGVVSLVANTDFASVGRNFNITSGTLNAAGFAFAVNSLLTISAGGRLLCNGGTATAGSWSILGEISCGTGQGITWTGLAGDNLWSTAGNWTNNTIPGATDIAIFNASVCVAAACNAQINSNLSVRGIILQSTYTGTLTQNATRTLTVGVAGYTQAGGTFAGGDAAVTLNGVFTLSGGVYTATSGTCTQSADMTVSGAPTFNHNSGSWTTTSVMTMTPNGIALFNATFGGGPSVHQNLNSGTLIIAGTLTLTGTHASTPGHVNLGTIEVRGNLTSTGIGKLGSVIVVFNSADAQSLTAANTFVPAIRINKGGGTLTLNGIIRTANEWTWMLGAVDATASHLRFEDNQTITPGPVIYNDVTFTGSYRTQNLNSGTMVINGTLTVEEIHPSTPGFINSGTIEAQGNVVGTGVGKEGSAILLINSGGAQSLTGAVAGSFFPTVQINKAAGTLTLSGTIRMLMDWTWMLGAVDAGTSTLSFENNLTITPGPVIYNNVSFGGSARTQSLNSGTMIVTGTLTFSDVHSSATGSVNTGTIEAHGNIATINFGKHGSAVVQIKGTGPQTFTGTAGRCPTIQIDKPSDTLTLAGTISPQSDWTWLNGTVDAGASTVSFGYASTITPGGFTYNNVTFAGAAVAQNLSAGTMIVGGTLSFAGTNSTSAVNNGNIEARGNVSSTGSGKVGTAVLTMNGNAAGTLTWAAAASLLTTTFTVSKTGGSSVLLGANALFSSVGRDITIASGTLNLSGYDLSVADVLTVDVGATLKCNGGEFTALTLTNNGTVNCPGHSTYDFNWTGAGGNSNWSTPGNWQGGVSPGVNDIVVFEDTYCGGNCNSSIDTNVSIKGAHLRIPYTGTITQGVGNTVTIGTRGYYQYAGNFVGSNSNISINLNSNSKAFSITGGSFTSTSAILQAGFTASSGGLTSRDTFIVGAGATFNHNSGTVRLTCYEATSGATVCTVNAPSGLTFNNLSTYATNGYGGGTRVMNGQTLTVLGNLTVESGALLDQTTGYIDLHGDLNAQSNGTSNNKPLIVRFVGAGNQTYTTSGTDCTIRVEVNKTSGNVTPIGVDARLCSVKVTQGNFYAPTGNLFLGVNGHSIRSNINVLDLTSPAQFIDQGGTVDFNSVDVLSGNLVYTIKPSGTLTLSNVKTRGVGGFTGGHWVSVGDKIIVANTFQKITGRLGGSWELRGNSSFDGLSDGTAIFEFTGGLVQSISGAAAGSGQWTVNKSGGEIQFLNNINLSKVGQNLVVTAGTLNMAGYNLTVSNNISNSGTLQRGTNPTCGTISQGGSYTGTAAICP